LDHLRPLLILDFEDNQRFNTNPAKTFKAFWDRVEKVDDSVFQVEMIRMIQIKHPNQPSKFHNPKVQDQTSRSKIRNQKSEIKNPRSKFRSPHIIRGVGDHNQTKLKPDKLQKPTIIENGFRNPFFGAPL